jgi:hypothetical protein
MRDQTRATTWTCDSTRPSAGCQGEVVRTDLMQDVPPEGWRLVHVLREHGVNLALEADVQHRLVLCPTCYGQSSVAPEMRSTP